MRPVADRGPPPLPRVRTRELTRPPVTGTPALRTQAQWHARNVCGACAVEAGSRDPDKGALTAHACSGEDVRFPCCGGRRRAASHREEEEEEEEGLVVPLAGRPRGSPRMAELKQRLAFSIVQFLQDQLLNGGLSPDAQESLEVAIQCLETAFGVSMEDRSLALSQTLPEIFEAAAAKEPLPQMPTPDPAPLSEEDASEAERLKAEGNEQMKAENYDSAVSYYGKAIELNPSNAVYYCNRAAAYSKLGNYAGAVRDCERAIHIDPKYSKAYGRMGLALSSLNKLSEAVVYYRKALELDPDNETYKSNLKVTEQKMKEAPSPTGNPGGFDLAGLLNNPGFMSMASNLMNNPQVQQLMSGMISGGQNPTAMPGATPSPNDLASLIQAGQQFAQQMQQQNPELIEQLRSQIRSRAPSASNEEQQE